MPPRRTISPEEAARNTIATEIPRMVEAIAAKQGPGIDAGPVSAAKLLQQWGQRDPRIADADGLRDHLMQGPLPPEMLDPNGPDALAIVKQHPEIAQMYGQGPFDQQMADMLARIAEFPLRLGHLAQWEDDPEGMVKEAERMDGLWQRSFGVGAEPAPMLELGG
jgi:hypothetical protein